MKTIRKYAFMFHGATTLLNQFFGMPIILLMAAYYYNFSMWISAGVVTVITVIDVWKHIYNIKNGKVADFPMYKERTYTKAEVFELTFQAFLHGGETAHEVTFETEIPTHQKWFNDEVK